MNRFFVTLEKARVLKYAAGNRPLDGAPGR